MDFFSKKRNEYFAFIIPPPFLLQNLAHHTAMDPAITLESFKDKFSPQEYLLLEQELGKRKKFFQALLVAYRHDEDSLIEALKEFLSFRDSKTEPKHDCKNPFLFYQVH